MQISSGGKPQGAPCSGLLLGPLKLCSNKTWVNRRKTYYSQAKYSLKATDLSLCLVLSWIPSYFLTQFLGQEDPLGYSCLENPMDRGAWWATVHGVTGLEPLSD